MNKKFLFAIVPVLGLAMLFGYTGSSVTTPTQFLSVPPAAFIPIDNNTDYMNVGIYLMCYGGCVLSTPIYLDQDMVVSKVTLYYYDFEDLSSDLTLQLLRTDNEGNYDILSELSSQDDGNGSTFDNTIDFAAIDNVNFAYALTLFTHSDDAWFYRAVIEYSYPNGIAFPMISRNSSTYAHK